MIKTIRCSKLPLALVCPASQQPGDYPTTSDGDAARLGTAVHEWIGARILRAEDDDGRLEVIACKFGLDVDEVRPLALRAWKLWQEIAKWFPEPMVEQFLGDTYADQDRSLVLTGTIDVVSYDPERKTVFINDHKTGWLDSDHVDQVKGYGYLALRKFPQAEQAHCVIMRVRDFCCDHQTYTREQLAAWFGRVVERLTDEAGHYNPGRHCANCPRWTDCPAYRDYTRASFAILDTFTGEMGIATPREVYDSVKTLERLCVAAREALKSQALLHGGSLPLDDDYELRLVSQPRQEIVFGPALPVLRRHLSETEIAGAVKVKKTEVQNLVKAKAGRGEKGQAVAALMSELDAAGALDQSTIERLELKRRELPVITQES